MPDTIGLKDPRTNYHHEVIQGVELGPLSSTYQAVQANSQTSTSNVTFSIVPPGQASGVGRFMRLHVIGSVAIVCSAGTIATNPIKVAFRQWPLNSIISTSTAQINDTAISLQSVNTLVPVVSRIANSFANMNSYQSGTATSPDLLTRYNQLAGSFFDVFNSSMPVGDVNQGRRAQFTSQAIAGNTLTLGFEIFEPILNPLFQSDKEEVVALTGINTININLNYANLHKMFSIYATAPGTVGITSVTPTFTTQEVLLNYVTSSDMLYKQLPSYYSVPNIRLDQSSSASTITQGTSITATTANIQLQKVPRYVVIWVTPTSNLSNSLPGATAGGGTAGGCGIVDLILPITNITVSAFDKSGLLAGANANQLYTMSCNAGLTNTTYPQFSSASIFGDSITTAAVGTYNSAPVVIPFSNLSLALGIAPDSDLSSTFQATVTFKYMGGNTDATGAEVGSLPGYTVNVMTIIDGILELDNGRSSYLYGGLSTADVMGAIEASRDEVLTIENIRKTSMIMGAGFWDKIRSGFRSAGNWIKNAAEKAAPVAKQIYSYAKPLVHEGLTALGPEGVIASEALTKLGGARTRLRQHHPRA